MEEFLSYFSLTANLQSGRARREYLEINGDRREYLVATATLIVPGVLNGSQGSLYYPPDEISSSTNNWDNIPIVLRHPFINGNHVSANHPGILDKYGLGFLSKPTYNNKLQAEAWFDVEKTKVVDSRVYNWLLVGKPFELSTGLYTNNHIAPPNSVYNSPSGKSKRYTHIARNYKPDHLAVLPDEKGACSIDDGCGVLINQLIETAQKQQQQTSTSNIGVTMEEKLGIIQQVINWLTGNKQTQTTDNANPSSSLDMTPEKACKIVKDGEVHGKPLTEDQKGMFGAKCGERANNSGNQLNCEYKDGTCTKCGHKEEEEEEEKKTTTNEVVPEIVETQTPTIETVENQNMDRNATINWLTTNCDCGGR